MTKDPAKPNGKDPGSKEAGVTDLQRYRREKEKAAKRPPPAPKRPRESFLGANPRAGVILVVVLAILVLLYLGPRFL